MALPGGDQGGSQTSYKFVRKNDGSWEVRDASNKAVGTFENDRFDEMSQNLTKQGINFDLINEQGTPIDRTGKVSTGSAPGAAPNRTPAPGGGGGGDNAPPAGNDALQSLIDALNQGGGGGGRTSTSYSYNTSVDATPGASDKLLADAALAREQAQLDPQKLAETIRANKATEAQNAADLEAAKRKTLADAVNQLLGTQVSAADSARASATTLVRDVLPSSLSPEQAGMIGRSFGMSTLPTTPVQINTGALAPTDTASLQSQDEEKIRGLLGLAKGGVVSKLYRAADGDTVTANVGTGEDPLIKARASAMDVLERLAAQFGTVPQATIDAVAATYNLPPGSIKLGDTLAAQKAAFDQNRATNADAEAKRQFDLTLKQTGDIEKARTAATIAAENIRAGAQTTAATIAAGASTKNVATTTAAQKEIAANDLAEKAREFGLTFTEDQRRNLAAAAANPRRVIEAAYYQAGMHPTDAATALQNVITKALPGFSGANVPDGGTAGTAPAGGTPAPAPTPKPAVSPSTGGGGTGRWNWLPSSWNQAPNRMAQATPMAEGGSVADAMESALLKRAAFGFPDENTAAPTTGAPAPTMGKLPAGKTWSASGQLIDVPTAGSVPPGRQNMNEPRRPGQVTAAGRALFTPAPKPNTMPNGQPNVGYDANGKITADAGVTPPVQTPQTPPTPPQRPAYDAVTPQNLTRMAEDANRVAAGLPPKWNLHLPPQYGNADMGPIGAQKMLQLAQGMLRGGMSPMADGGMVTSGEEPSEETPAEEAAEARKSRVKGAVRKASRQLKRAAVGAEVRPARIPEAESGGLDPKDVPAGGVISESKLTDKNPPIQKIKRPDLPGGDYNGAGHTHTTVEGHIHAHDHGWVDEQTGEHKKGYHEHPQHDHPEGGREADVSAHRPDDVGGPSRMAKGGKVTIPAQEKGQKPVTFKKGALHEQLGVPANEKIPAKKMEAAASGSLGPLAKKRALFAKNFLHRAATGTVVPGPAILLVGEGRHGEGIKAGTHEYVHAAPGTIVAPGKKGEKPSMATAMAAIMRQLMKSKDHNGDSGVKPTNVSAMPPAMSGGMKMAAKGATLDPAKARKMLHEGRANGQKITGRQRRFFGAIASGEKPRRAAGGYIDPVLQPGLRQASTTENFDPLGGASSELRGSLSGGLPTFSGMNRMSGTQKGLFEAGLSAGGVDPNDVWQSITNQFKGFGANTEAGATARVVPKAWRLF